MPARSRSAARPIAASSRSRPRNGSSAGITAATRVCTGTGLVSCRPCAPPTHERAHQHRPGRQTGPELVRHPPFQLDHLHHRLVPAPELVQGRYPQGVGLLVNGGRVLADPIGQFERQLGPEQTQGQGGGVEPGPLDLLAVALADRLGPRLVGLVLQHGAPHQAQRLQQVAQRRLGVEPRDVEQGVELHRVDPAHAHVEPVVATLSHDGLRSRRCLQRAPEQRHRVIDRARGVLGQPIAPQQLDDPLLGHRLAAGYGEQLADLFGLAAREARIAQPAAATLDPKLSQ